MTGVVSVPCADLVVHFHDIQLAKYGGSEGIRDRGLVESAVGRVEMAMSYSEDMDFVDAAAMMAHAVIKNHAFVDGNKRTAFGCLSMMLRSQGHKIAEDPDVTVDAIAEFAASAGGYEDISSWVRERLVPMHDAAVEQEAAVRPH